MRWTHWMSTALAVIVTAGLHSEVQAQAPFPETGKVLYIVREFPKPGKSGLEHIRSESTYIHALEAAKSPIHYIAMSSISGPSRDLFLSTFSSFAEMETLHKAITPALEAEMDRASQADGELLSQMDESVWLRRDDLSSSTGSIPAGTRYMGFGTFLVKPGHDEEFQEMAKLYSEGVRNIPELHWTAYQEAYGESSQPAYIIITTYKSLSEVDAAFGAGGTFEKALGKDGLAKLLALEASCLQENQVNLFALAPKLSYPPDAFVQQDPDFWKPKPPAPKKAAQ